MRKQMYKAMILAGGYPEHEPCKVSVWMKHCLESEGYDVQIYYDCSCLDEVRQLIKYDIICPLYTMGLMTKEQTYNLITAVSEYGVAIVGFHSTADGFRGNIKYHMLTGSQFVDHPLGHISEYKVITDPKLGMENFAVTTELLFLLVSPAAEVLAYAEFEPSSHPYFARNEKPIKMPIVYRYKFGEGSVFYCSLGHNMEFIESCPELSRIMRYGIQKTRSED